MSNFEELTHRLQRIKQAASYWAFLPKGAQDAWEYMGELREALRTLQNEGFKNSNEISNLLESTDNQREYLIAQGKEIFEAREREWKFYQDNMDEFLDSFEKTFGDDKYPVELSRPVIQILSHIRRNNIF